MIPNFDHNNVIPPHLGDPTKRNQISPYECSTLELCQKFSTSHERIEILKNLLLFRQKMNSLGIIEGFQWLDGSFMENIEVSENRPPNDLDLVTFYGNLSENQEKEITTNFIEFISTTDSKRNYKLDHYLVDFFYDPYTTVELTRYWIQLFTHNRLGIWKGILKLELNTPEIDVKAIEYLNNLAL